LKRIFNQNPALKMLLRTANILPKNSLQPNHIALKHLYNNKMVKKQINC